MEKIKNMAVAMVAMVMIIGFSSFKLWEKTLRTEVKEQNIETTVKGVSVLWSFTGSNPSEVTNPAAYQRINGTPPSCTGSQVVCYIQAPDNGSNEPDLGQHLDPGDPSTPTYQDLIEEAMDSKEDNDVVIDFRSL